MSFEPETTRFKRDKTGTVIDLERFQAGLARLTTDATLRERLEKEPLAVLPELGITVDEKHRAVMQGKSVSELMAMPPGGEVEIGPVVATIVRAGVVTGVGVLVDIL